MAGGRPPLPGIGILPPTGIVGLLTSALCGARAGVLTGCVSGFMFQFLLEVMTAKAIAALTMVKPTTTCRRNEPANHPDLWPT